MPEYKEFEFGWLIFVFVLPIQIIVTWFYIYNLGDSPQGAFGILFISLIFILTCLLFYGMTTRITRDKIIISFGIGLISKKILLNRIHSVHAITNPWYYGWGIRFIPNGMLYNINGKDGVELKFKDSERIIRIGTKDPAKLQSEITKRLGLE